MNDESSGARRVRAISRTRKVAPGPIGEFGELPSLAEARRRMRSKPGFFSSLTPEAKAAMLAYDGHENLGPGDYGADEG